MIERDDSVIVTVFVRLSLPLAQTFGLYVLAHGHYSPGGGFQAGVILAATVVLVALALGRQVLDRYVRERALLALGAGGVLLYLLAGVAGLVLGPAFLDYSALPLGVSPVRARYLGILIVETGVTMTVAATLVVVFCRLADRDGRR
jgi:multicomponent Na+:H+ antiporter subunit B